MDLIVNTKQNTVEKTQIEQVQQQQQEYRFLDTHLRTPGLKLYQYNHHEDKVTEINLRSMHVGRLDENMNLLDAEMRCEIDSRFDVFEALNMKNAIKRVAKWKQGRVKYLFNLTKPNKINPYGLD